MTIEHECGEEFVLFDIDVVVKRKNGSKEVAKCYDETNGMFKIINVADSSGNYTLRREIGKIDYVSYKSKDSREFVSLSFDEFLHEGKPRKLVRKAFVYEGIESN